MIQQRYAVGTRPAVLPHLKGKGVAARQPRLPALSRLRLLHSLGGSVLVQLMLAMCFVALAALLYLAQASQVSVLEFNIAELQNEQSQLSSRNAALQAESTNLQSLQRVDAIATNQLHMTKPDLSTAVWLTPVSPRLAPLPPLGSDATAARRRSQPLADMQRVLSLLRSSL